MQNLKHCWMQINVKCLRTILKHLKSMRMVQKQRNCMPYKVKPRDVEKHFCTCKLLLQQQKKDFQHCTVIGDAKWIHYNNLKCRKSSCKPEPTVHINSKAEYCLKVFTVCSGGGHWFGVTQTGQIIIRDCYQQLV